MLISDFLSETMLFELDFYDKSSLVPLLKKYKDKWIHFSNGVPKHPAAKTGDDSITKVPHFGINHKTSWNDPRGIYFYPCSYLLTGADKILSGHQYGIEFKFYYICDIDQSKPGFNLGTVTWEDIDKLAQRNGWYKQWEEFKNLPYEEKKKEFATAKWVNYEKPGSVLWAFVDYNHNILSRDKAYRGLNWIYDPNLSIIHSNEPHQMLVLNPSIIKIIETGETKDVKQPDHQQDIATWKKFVLDFYKRIRGEYGNGTITWKYKQPTLEFDVGDAHFQIHTGDRGRGNDTQLVLVGARGRMKTYKTISEKLKYEKKSAEELLDMVFSTVNRVVGYKTDMIRDWAKGVFAGKDVEKATAQLFENEIFNRGTHTFSADSSDSDNPKYISASYRDVDSVEFAHSSITHNAHISFHYGTITYNDRNEQDLYSINVSSQIITGRTSWRGDKQTVHCGHVGENIPINEQPNWIKIAQDYAEKMRQNLNILSPDSMVKDKDRKFATQEEYEAFVGYVALEGGVSFGGELVNQFTKEVNAWLDIVNKREFKNKIDNVLYRSLGSW